MYTIKKILKYLATHRHATRAEIVNGIGAGEGGHFSSVLEDLEKCGFIEKYVPIHLPEESKIARYCLADAYVQFYYLFLAKEKKNIAMGVYSHAPKQVLNLKKMETSLGFVFERWCRSNAASLSRMMNFGTVRYKYGAFYNRALSQKLPGFQIDLLY